MVHGCRMTEWIRGLVWIRHRVRLGRDTGVRSSRTIGFNLAAMYEQLYKYTKEEWALGMIEKGEFWIGTLHNYQDSESHGNEIGDEGEGTKTRFSTDSVNTEQPSPGLNFLAQNMFKNRIPRHWKISGIKVEDEGEGIGIDDQAAAGA